MHGCQRSRMGAGVFCPSCGSNIPDGVKFCPKCSTCIKREAPTAANDAPVAKDGPAQEQQVDAGPSFASEPTAASAAQSRVHQRRKHHDWRRQGNELACPAFLDSESRGLCGSHLCGRIFYLSDARKAWSHGENRCGARSSWRGGRRVVFWVRGFARTSAALAACPCDLAMFCPLITLAWQRFYCQAKRIAWRNVAKLGDGGRAYTVARPVGCGLVAQCFAPKK